MVIVETEYLIISYFRFLDCVRLTNNRNSPIAFPIFLLFCHLIALLISLLVSEVDWDNLLNPAVIMGGSTLFFRSSSFLRKRRTKSRNSSHNVGTTNIIKHLTLPQNKDIRAITHIPALACFECFCHCFHP